MATKTRERADLRSLRRKIDDIWLEDGVNSGQFVQAVEKFLTAAGYQDEALIRSALEEAKAALGELLVESVEDVVTRSSAGLEVFQQFTDQFEGALVEPDEQFDDLGRSISNVVRVALPALIKFRDGSLAMARRHRVQVPNAARLDEHIVRWEAVKVNLVDCWPWTDAPLPPADREMIAAARAARQAGEPGEDIDALIARLRSE